MKRLVNICFFVFIFNFLFAQDEFISSLYLSKSSYLKDSASVKVLSKNVSFKKNEIRIQNNNKLDTYFSGKIYAYKHLGRVYVYNEKKQKFLLHIVKLDEINVYVDEKFFSKSFYTSKNEELVKLKKKIILSDINLNEDEKQILKYVRKKQINKEILTNTRTCILSFMAVCTFAYFEVF